ncbi:transcriptional regulator [Candidatus Dependentiae bacterium Noda2021]|nr:transcriptional regulator [Candidatus Dependentiae bacterium Noda2021]
MNKSELINSLSEETAFSKKDVTRVLETLTRIIERTLKKGEKVSITGFGSFWLSQRPARKGINPSTKQRIDLPAVNVPRFKAGKNLREVVRSIKLG